MKIKVSEKNKEFLKEYSSKDLLGFIDEVKDELCILTKPRKEYMDFEVSDELYAKLALYSSHNCESIDDVLTRLFVLKDILDFYDSDVIVPSKSNGLFS